MLEDGVSGIITLTTRWPTYPQMEPVKTIVTFDGPHDEEFEYVIPFDKPVSPSVKAASVLTTARTTFKAPCSNSYSVETVMRLTLNKASSLSTALGMIGARVNEYGMQLGMFKMYKLC